MPRTLKELKRSYGFEDVAIAPGDITLNPEMVDISMKIDGTSLRVPVIASAMDAVVDPAFAVAMSKAGGLAVMNLDGIQTRYDDPKPLFIEIAEAPRDAATELLQKIYSQPVKENLIGKRVEEIKRGGGVAAVSVIPANTKKYAPAAVEAGAEVVVVQSTVTTARHSSRSVKGLIFHEFVSQIKAPVLVGNTVNYDVTLELMEEGVHGVLVGVGPGAACTSREVLGVGVPQVSATLECAAAREEYFKTTGRYVPIITDGGIRTGGDVCKSFASGADAVMIGTPLAQAIEAPGRGFNWGMAAPSPTLPRGTRITLRERLPLEQILFGPAQTTHGTQNLVGALRQSMGALGARTIRDLHQVEMVVAPTIGSEGKSLQRGSDPGT